MTLTYFRDYQELFRGCVRYWDGSFLGSAYYDLMGSANGTVVSAVATNDRFGIPNRGLLYTESGKYVAVSNPFDSIGTGDFTIVTWFYPTRLPNSELQTILSLLKVNGSWFPGTSIGISQYSFENSGIVSTRFYVCSSGDGAALSVTCPIQINNWYMLSSKRASGVLYGYLNASLLGSIDGNYNISNTYQGYIGCINFNGTPGNAWFSGKIGEIMIFTRALSDVELKMLYGLMLSKRIMPIYPGIRGVE